LQRLNKENMDKMRKQMNEDKASRDELIGYIIRKSHESDHSVKVNYEEIMAVFRGMNSYFSN